MIATCMSAALYTAMEVGFLAFFRRSHLPVSQRTAIEAVKEIKKFLGDLQLNRSEAIDVIRCTDEPVSQVGICNHSTCSCPTRVLCVAFIIQIGWPK